MRPPRDYTALQKQAADASKSPGAQQAEAQPEKPLPEPTRPREVRAPPMPVIEPMSENGPKAQKYHNWVNAEAIKADGARQAQQAPPKITGKAAIQADIAKAMGNQPAQGQARQAENAPEAQKPRGQAGVEADMVKAMQKETQQKPSDKGRGR